MNKYDRNAKTGDISNLQTNIHKLFATDIFDNYRKNGIYGNLRIYCTTVYHHDKDEDPFGIE